MGIRLPAQNKIGKSSEKLGFLSSRMTTRIFLGRHLRVPALHAEIASVAIEVRVGNDVPDPVSVKRQNEVVDPDVSLRPAQVSELLMLGQEGTVVGCGGVAVEKDFARELGWNRIGAVCPTGCIEEASGYRPRNLIVHRPKDKTEVVPTQVAHAP